MHTEPHLRRPSGLPLFTALACTLCLAAGAAHAGPSGYWERISAPTNAGATAYSGTHQQLYVFGGDGTSIVHTVPAGDPPVE